MDDIDSMKKSWYGTLIRRRRFDDEPGRRAGGKGGGGTEGHLVTVVNLSALVGVCVAFSVHSEPVISFQ